MIDALISTVLVVRDAADEIDRAVGPLQVLLAGLATDYEIVVVDNASRDGTVARLEALAARLPNLQVYCLSNAVDDDVARLAGIEQAIGDHVVLLSLDDDIRQIPRMIECAQAGRELVTVARDDGPDRRARGLAGLAARLFRWLYRSLSGFDLRGDAPRFRLMSRRLVNYVLQHENAYITYRLLPLTGGFNAERLRYRPADGRSPRALRGFRESVNQGIALLISTSTVPLRLITLACGVAGTFSLLYSIYVFLVYFLKDDVAEGWTTISLQISVQFFLLAFAVAMLAEYLVQILRQSSKRPRYYIAREFRSGQIARELRLNVRGDGGGEAAP